MTEFRKGYISRWKRRPKPEQHIIDYWFSGTPQSAAIWGTRIDAENDCTAIFSRFGIDIEAAIGAYHCTKFVVEERSPGEFVVSCEAPFKGDKALEVSSEGRSDER